MKTFRFIGFALFAILMCLSACSGGGDEPIEPTPKPEDVKSEITIDSNIISNGLSFSDAKGEQSISFTTNENWTLSVASTTSGTTWCTASATSGSKGTATVKFEVAENTTYDNRSVSVTIKSGTASKTFTISQKGVDALLVTTDKYEVSQEGGSIEIEVKANISYKMEISENAKDWIKESSSRALTTHKHKLDIAINEDVEKREGEIMFKSGDKVETVKIYQAGGAIILLSQNEYTVSDAGDTISVEIKSNVEFGVQMPEVDWIVDEASSRGLSSHTLKYIVNANEEYDARSASIVFYDKNSDLKDTLKVVQTQKDAIVVAKNEYTIESTGGELKFEVNTNVDFEISTSVDWIKQNTESRGLEAKPLNFTIDENTTEEAREGVITISSGDLKQEIKIIQKAISVFSLSTTEFNVGSTGGEIQVNVSTNGEYAVTMPKVDWLKEVKSRATATYTHTFCISENKTHDAREAEITFTHKETNEAVKVKVIQAQKDDIIIAKSEYTIDAAGGNLGFEVNTNVDFEVSTSVDWIKQNTESRGLEAKPLSFIIAENQADEVREGVITISSGNLKQDIKVVQKAKSIFSLFETEFNIASEGGEFKVEVSTNGEYTITMPEVNWLKENESRATSAYVHTFTVLANETYDARETEIVFTHKETSEVAKVKVIQAQKDGIIISEKNFNVTQEGETIEVKVNANVNFEIQIPSNITWVTNTRSRALVEKSIYLKVAENANEENRSAEITFFNKDSQISEIITIIQAGAVKASYTDGTVSIAKAGTMEALLGEDYLNITSLKVVGPINGDDVRCLRQMLGGIEFNDSEKGKLSALDLSEALIVQGGKWYYELNSWTKYYTSNDVIGNNMFETCKNLQEIVLPKSATSIGDDAFRGCSLTSIDIPDNIASIGEYTFCASSLTSVTIGKGVTSIGTEAFYLSSSLTSVYIKDLSAWCNITFDNPNSNPLNNGAKLYFNNKEITELAIPEDITEIKNNTFSNCKSLKKVSIGNKITSIGRGAFRGCSFLNSVTIGKSVIEIGYEAFRGCSSLISIDIPTSVTSIGDYTFYGCSSLASIDIPDGVTSIGDYTFYGCSSLASINIPDSVTAIGKYSFKNCSYLASVTIGKSVIEIGYEAFRGCSSLISIDIPDSVISIDKFAFWKCFSLTTVTFGKSLTTIGDNAFRECPLISIELPDALTSIGVNAFAMCPLTSVTIGKGIISIGSCAFTYCSSLIDFYIYAVNPPQTGTNAFSWINDQATLHVPSGCKNKYKSLDPWNWDFKTIKEMK